MIKIQPITGKRKWFVNQEIKLVVFFYFTWRMILGEIRPRYYLRFLRRLLYFLSKMHHNKYVRIGKRIKINLYVPAFPSKAFFVACRKVYEFDQKMPCVTALVSITAACRFQCAHCYQRHDKGKDLDLETLLETARKMQDQGIAFFNIEGGEPFLVYDRLLALCKTIDDRSEILINSTGDGMTLERLMELKENCNLIGVMFSLHTAKSNDLNQFMGSDSAWNTLEAGIRMCHDAGIAVMFNSCVSRAGFYDGGFEKILDVAQEFNGALIQLIKPKPAGGWLESGADRFDKKDAEVVKEKVALYNLGRSYTNYPFISCMLQEEEPELFGCTAGGTDRFYLNAKGDVQPCEFLNLSFGNVRDEKFERIYARMRACFCVPGDCLLCEKYSGMVHRVFMEQNLSSLPLPPKVSEKMMHDWDRGKPADFYRKTSQL